MLATAGQALGYRFISWDPLPDGPAQQVCDDSVVAAFDDAAAAARFAKACDLITFEWENVPAELAERLQAKIPVRPDPSVLRIVQDRLVQRDFLKKHGFPQTEYRNVNDRPGLEKAFQEIGAPCILKARRLGYDGKGQARLSGPRELHSIREPLKHILERHVPFIKEVSVILARAQDGRTAVYPIAENVHKNGILHTTLAPARIPAGVEKTASALAVAVASKLRHVGVMAVEMFWLGGDGKGQLLINEIAPRVHNSGHYTWGACRTSQFEQHIRAICGLPLGDVKQHTPAVMINLLGDLWANGEPNWSRARARARLCLYGKSKPAPGRKMGHLLLLGDVERSLAQVEKLI